jgi:hypothetical protein
LCAYGADFLSKALGFAAGVGFFLIYVLVLGCLVGVGVGVGVGSTGGGGGIVSRENRGNNSSRIARL